jgi:hypothetical protein
MKHVLIALFGLLIASPAMAQTYYQQQQQLPDITRGANGTFWYTDPQTGSQVFGHVSPNGGPYWIEEQNPQTGLPETRWGHVYGSFDNDDDN